MTGDAACDYRSAGIDSATGNCIICAMPEMEHGLRFVAMGEEILQEIADGRRNCPMRAQQVNIANQIERGALSAERCT